MLKYITMPGTSTIVATDGAKAVAGSKFEAFKAKGSIDPASEPKVTMATSYHVIGGARVPTTRAEVFGNDHDPLIARQCDADIGSRV